MAFRSLVRLICVRASMALAGKAVASKGFVPTTILGGFLGAGKTTALTHMLTNREGLRIAVLVNDVASVNVDAATLRRTTGPSGIETVELENGCVCCGPGADGLSPAVRSLAERVDADGRMAFDHVIIELSGVADPSNVISNLRAGGVGVERKVALVDAHAFPSLYNSVAEVGDRVDLAGENDVAEMEPCAVDTRIVELLLAQIESADVVLVNKCDLASGEEVKVTTKACRVLNERATIRTTTFGETPLADLLPSPDAVKAAALLCGTCTDPAGTDSSAAATTAADNDVRNSASSLGFHTFVYRARRPFVQQRLARLVRRWPLPSKELLTLDSLASPGGETLAAASAARDATFANVLRSKGKCWLNSQHRQMAFWSHAGRHFRLNPAGVWWATLPEPVMRACLAADGEDTEAHTEDYERERANFAESDGGGFGDRRQEIVFIGTRLDRAAITSALDACLASDDEMDEYRAVWAVDDERARAANGPFRFPVGDAVVCRLGNGDWERGTVTKQYYREATWATDQWVPYEVRLDVVSEAEGEIIWPREDMDWCIRAAK